MQVKIRPVNNGWHKGEQFEWQLVPSSNGKWYSLWSKNVMRYPHGDPQLRRRAGIATHKVMSALLVGMPIQCHATYDRKTRKLFIMEPDGKREE